MPTYDDIIFSAETYLDLVRAIHEHPEHADDLRDFLVEWILDDLRPDEPLEPQDPAAAARAVERAMQRFWAKLRSNGR